MFQAILAKYGYRIDLPPGLKEFARVARRTLVVSSSFKQSIATLQISSSHLPRGRSVDQQS